ESRASRPAAIAWTSPEVGKMRYDDSNRGCARTGPARFAANNPPSRNARDVGGITHLLGPNRQRDDAPAARSIRAARISMLGGPARRSEGVIPCKRRGGSPERAGDAVRSWISRATQP